MSAKKNTVFSWTLVALWILISSFWGCASKNARTGSLRLQGNDYEKLLQRQTAKSSLEAPTPDKLPAMTDAEHERLGDTYFRQGNLERAFVHYEKALRMNPNKTLIRHKQGVIFLARGGNQEAIEAFQEVLKKEPHHALAHEGTGQAFFRMGRFPDAKRHFQQALKGNPKLWKAHNLLGIIHDYERRPEAAIEGYQAAIALKQDEGLLYNNLGISYSLMGEYGKAAVAFKEALKTSPSHRKIHNNLGLVLSKLGKYEEALEAFRRGGDEAQAYNNLGCIYLYQGEHQKAIRSFEKAMELAPTFYAKANENLKRAKTASLKESSFFPNRNTESTIPRSSPAPVEQKSEPTLRPSGTLQKMVHVTGSLVNIRTGASKKNKVITRVKRGDELEVLGETDSWYNVRLSNEMEGWIYKKAVK